MKSNDTKEKRVKLKQVLLRMKSARWLLEEGGNQPEELSVSQTSADNFYPIEFLVADIMVI